MRHGIAEYEHGADNNAKNIHPQTLPRVPGARQNRESQEDETHGANL
jgi:hypothetical protein